MGASAVNASVSPVAASPPIRIVTLVALFSVAPVWEAIHLTALANTDVWWHLRTGLWILNQHFVPHAGLFSQYLTLTWHDFSWSYDIVLAAAYKVLGLRAIVLALMTLRLAFAVVAYRLARSAGSSLWTAILLSAIAQYVIPGLQPTPSSVSVLFFGVELLLILESRRSGSSRPLFWLAPLFVLWANVDIQVVFGFTLILIFVVALACEAAFRRLEIGIVELSDRPLSVKTVSVILGLSVVCAMLSPYSIHVFSSFARTLYSGVGFRYFADMCSMSFRRPQEYIFVLLVMAAFLALGRRRRLQPFELLVLIPATLLAFRIQRDAWLAVLPAVLILGSATSTEASHQECVNAVRWRSALAVTLTGVFILLAVVLLPSNSRLTHKLSQSYPAQACDYIAKNHLPQPIFNVYSWGGFVTWYLPEYPVSIDSRVDLYGDEILDRYFQVISGKMRLDADPSFASARTLLLEPNSGMAKALTSLPALSSQFRMVYRDEVAAVFVRR